jgi:hypothetical protein
VQVPAPAPSAPPPAAPPAPAERVAAGPAPSKGLFDDLDEADFDVDFDDGAAPLAAPAFTAGAGPWPANVPGTAEAADALARGFAGLFDPPGSPLAVVADVVNALSALERAVLAGEGVAVDAGPIRRAAVMRVRVAAALASAPAGGGDVDPAAVGALLAEIDALLSDVGALAAGAAPEVQPSLEAIRNALVKEAIDLSEVAQRLAPAGEASAQQQARTPRAPQARVLSMSAAEDEAKPARRPWMWVALAVSLTIAGAFHGWNWYQRRAALAARPAGVPAGLTEVPLPPGAPRVLRPVSADEQPDPAELEKLKALEEAKGNAVQEIDGTVLIVPGAVPARPPNE